MDNVEAGVDTEDSTVLDTEGLELIGHSASTIPSKTLLTQGKESVKIVELEPEETSEELFKLFVESIQRAGWDKWSKLKCDQDFAELMTGNAELSDSEDFPDEEDESNPAKDEENIARCCNRNCKAVFRTREELIGHGIQIHGDREEKNAAKPFKCLVCFGRFKTRRSLVGHMRLLIRDYQCRTCDMFFNTQREQEAHNKINHTEAKTHQGRPYKIEEQPIKFCCGCEAEFKTVDELYQHGVHVHKENAALSDRLDVSHECNICYKLFKSKARVRHHQNSAYRLKRFVCGICLKSFDLYSKLITHKQSHTSERKFSCEICGGKYKLSSDLRRHRKTHEEPKLVCSTCGARFRKGCHLRTHLKVHDASPNEFTCHVCEKQFKHKFTLKAHFRIHSGERPFQCPHCAGRFIRSRDLQTHLRKFCEREGK